MSLALNKPHLKLNLQGVTQLADGDFSLSESKQLSQFQSQLPKGVIVQGFDKDSPISLLLFKLSQKKVKIETIGVLSPAQNYFLLEKKIFPDSVWVRGSTKSLASIEVLATNFFKLDLIKRSLDTLIEIDVEMLPPNVFIAPEQVRLSAKFAEFSERVFKSPIVVNGLPKGYEVHFFPNRLEFIVAAPLEVLKELTAADFVLNVNFEDLFKTEEGFVVPEILYNNSLIYKTHLKSNAGVEFILSK